MRTVYAECLHVLSSCRESACRSAPDASPASTTLSSLFLLHFHPLHYCTTLNLIHTFFSHLTRLCLRPSRLLSLLMLSQALGQSPRLRAHALPSSPCMTGWQGMCMADKQCRWQTGSERCANSLRGECRIGVARPGIAWFYGKRRLTRVMTKIEQSPRPVCVCVRERYRFHV